MSSPDANVVHVRFPLVRGEDNRCAAPARAALPALPISLSPCELVPFPAAASAVPIIYDVRDDVFREATQRDVDGFQLLFGEYGRLRAELASLAADIRARPHGRPEGELEALAKRSSRRVLIAMGELAELYDGACGG